MTTRATSTTAARADALRELHAGPTMLVLPNAWDAASAKAFEAAGFPAIATTSGGVAAALGYSDHEGAPVDEMLAAAARIIRAVSIPVTVDFESGYQLAPDAIAKRLVGIGAAGLNLEDSAHQGENRLLDAEAQAKRVLDVKAAARALGVDLVLNARVDVFISRLGTMEEQATEGLRRAMLYRDAGADCIYPITLADRDLLSRFVEAVGPININVRPGGPLSLADAAALGVRRVSYATSIFRETVTLTEQIAAKVNEERLALHQA